MEEAGKSLSFPEAAPALDLGQGDAEEAEEELEMAKPGVETLRKGALDPWGLKVMQAAVGVVEAEVGSVEEEEEAEVALNLVGKAAAALAIVSFNAVFGRRRIFIHFECMELQNAASNRRWHTSGECALDPPSSLDF